MEYQQPQPPATEDQPPADQPPVDQPSPPADPPAAPEGEGPSNQEVVDQVAALTEQVNELTGKVDPLAGDVSVLVNRDLPELKQRVEAVAGDVSTLQHSTVPELGRRIDEQGQDVIRLKDVELPFMDRRVEALELGDATRVVAALTVDAVPEGPPQGDAPPEPLPEGLVRIGDVRVGAMVRIVDRMYEVLGPSAAVEHEGEIKLRAASGGTIYARTDVVVEAPVEAPQTA